MESPKAIVETESIFLYPATITVSQTPANIQTILGSCVSVCLYDLRRGVGGMNHYMVAFWNGTGLASPKYGNIAIEMLLEKMLQTGSRKNDIVAKVFGGASQYEYNNRILAVGDRNAEIAETELEAHRITIVSRSLGGTLGRKIVFNTHSGRVMMKYITKQNNNQR